MTKISSAFSFKIHYKDMDMYSVLYHPKYFEICDSARNEAFKEFGYPVEKQLSDKVGFTVGGITDVQFKRPIFISESLYVFTRLQILSPKNCLAEHWIQENPNYDDQLMGAIFKAKFNLVFVSIEEVIGYPLNNKNIEDMKVIPFNEMALRMLT
jgi:YbgC/YbaW family acyl-CoA thioester hydrolase